MTLASGYTQPSSIAVSDGFVYWSSAEGVTRVPVGGGAVTTIAAGSAGDSLVIDAHNAYVAAAGGQSVVRMALDGGAQTTIVPQQGPLESFALAVQDSTVYWTADGVGGRPGVVARASAGGEIVTLATGPQPGMLGIADGRLYWSQVSDRGDAGLVSTPLQGGALVTVAGPRVAGRGLGGPYVVVQGDALYSVFGAVVRIPLDGGAVSTLSSGPGLGTIQAVVSDSDGIYWATYDSIRCIALGGSEPTMPVTLGSGSNGPYKNATIAVDETSVYWADYKQGIVAKVPKL